MDKIRKLLSLIPALVLWLMLSVLVWGFVFTRITDIDAAHKLTLFVDAEVMDGTALAVRMEESLGGSIRMVKVHPFSYAMLDGAQLQAADLFIIRADHMETYGDWLSALQEEMRGVRKEYSRGGVSWGIQVYDKETRCAVASEYINYQPSGEPEDDYYLCFGKQSLHILSNPNAVDNAALDAARLLLKNESFGQSI